MYLDSICSFFSKGLGEAYYIDGTLARKGYYNNFDEYDLELMKE